MEEVKRYAKPEGFKGRGNSKNYKNMQWECILYDKDSGTIKQGKFPTKEKKMQNSVKQKKKLQKKKKKNQYKNEQIK